MKGNVVLHKQPIYLHLEFDSRREVENLYHSLTLISPSTGWSEIARQFFELLRKAAGS